MDKETEGIVVSVKKQWWLSIRTKALRTGPAPIPRSGYGAKEHQLF